MRSERTIHKEGLYGAPLPGPGWDLPHHDAWPENAALRIGTSGWAYRHWLGRLYPRNMGSQGMLSHFAARFPTVEVDSTYYRLPSERILEGWRDGTPPGFRFTIKSPGAITHDARLVSVEEETAEFLDRAAHLGEKLGVILFQFPPGFHADLGLMRDFLAILPRGPRYAVELRHRSWFERDTYALLRRHNVAFVVHDHNEKGSPIVTTASHAYLRLHGPTGRYRGLYGAETLFQWAELVREWLRDGLEVWCYLNNDERGKSVQNALELEAYATRGPPRRARRAFAVHRVMDA